MNKAIIILYALLEDKDTGSYAREEILRAISIIINYSN